MAADTGAHVVEVERRIAAPPDEVFGYLTDPRKYVRWKGLEAQLDPRPGGRYRVQMTEDSAVAGSFVAVEPPTRVVFTWGWEGNDELPPGTSTVEITLTEDGDGTLLKLRHSGLPDAASADLHRTGWVHFGDRLTTVAGGGDPGPDPVVR
jgi:uncharacterized protein YndB with AHSA1/START domain